MTTEGHDEERVRSMVVAAVEGLEAPDRGRLAAIEQRLLARTRRRAVAHMRWWLLLVGLAAGGAVALWALNDERLFGDAAAPDSVEPVGPTERPERTAAGQPREQEAIEQPSGDRAEAPRKDAAAAQDDAARDDGPVIHIRP